MRHDDINPFGAPKQYCPTLGSLLLSKRFLLCLVPLLYSFITFLACVHHRVEKSGFKYTNLAYCLILSGKLFDKEEYSL